MRRAIAETILMTCAGWLAPAQSPEAPPKFPAADVRVSSKTANPSVRPGLASGGRYEVQTATMVDLIELAYGKAMKAEDRKPGPVAVYGSNGQVGWHDEALARGPGIVVGRKGNPGTVIWVTGDFFPIDTAFYVVPKSPQLGLGFLYHALRNHDLASLGADSAVPGLNRNLAYMSRQLVPPMPIVDEFDRLVKGLSQRGHTCALEASSLSALRDALLLQLLSGPASMPGGGMTLGAS